MPITTIAPAINRPLAKNSSSTLRIFAAEDGHVLTRKQLSPGVKSAWEAPSNVGTPGVVKQFATGNDVLGRINAFALTATGGCYSILETGANTGLFP
jgi:hypothetical protein